MIYNTTIKCPITSYNLMKKSLLDLGCKRITEKQYCLMSPSQYITITYTDDDTIIEQQIWATPTFKSQYIASELIDNVAWTLVYRDDVNLWNNVLQVYRDGEWYLNLGKGSK